MGLERIASVLQGVDSNFDIDIMKRIMEETQVHELFSIPDVLEGFIHHLSLSMAIFQ